MWLENEKKFAAIKSQYVQEHPEVANKSAKEIEQIVNKEVNRLIK